MLFAGLRGNQRKIRAAPIFAPLDGLRRSHLPRDGRLTNSAPPGTAPGQKRNGENIMSVKQEHRNSARLAREAKDRNACYRQREAMRLIRSPRPPVICQAPSDVATRSNISSWMRINADQYANATELAEGANCALKLPSGCMDDETHWIWDLAYRYSVPA